MCLGNKAAKRAAAAQQQAMAQLIAAQNAKLTNMVSDTNQTVKTNKDGKKRSIYSLRIPINREDNDLQSFYGLNIPQNNYGLNIPM